MGSRLTALLLIHIWTVAHHTCIDHHKFYKRFSDTAPEDMHIISSNPTAEDILEKRQRAALGFRVMKLASEACQELWALYYTEGLKYAEIAGMQGKSENTIKWRMADCIARAKNILKSLKKETNFFDLDSPN